MKKTTLLISGILFCLALSAQAPQGIANQAIIRNSNNELMANAAIGIRVSILQSSFEGNAVYVETHTVQSNAAGLITYVIGEGAVESGQFTAIEWANGPFFLKTEVDTEGGTNYTMSGTSQMLSVPYALEAKHASSLTLTDDYGNKYQIKVDENGNLVTTQVVQTWQCGDPFTDARDGQTYNTVQIGNQCWMAENLKFETTYSWCYDNNTENCDNYGRIYNWGEAIIACPSGWHLSSDIEWTALTNHLGGQGVAGGKLKSTRIIPDPHPRWDSPNSGATNESNFSALPGGNYYTDLSYDIGSHGYWWSATESSSTDAWFWFMVSSASTVYRDNYFKDRGFSVRCLKDSSPPTTHSLNLNVNPSGAGNVTGAGQYEAGYQVSITADANPGWEFVNWTNETSQVVSTQASFLYTMPAGDVILTANFSEQQTGFSCGQSFTDTRDGQTYNTVQIGDQCWMKENLNYETADSWCYDNNTENCDNYGRLYTWYAAMAGAQSSSVNPSGVQGVCPAGWHLPSDAEWTQLTDYCVGESVAGGKLKSLRTEPEAHPRWSVPNIGATDETGFSALPGGYRYAEGAFNIIGSGGYWLGSTEYSSTSAWGRNMSYNYGSVTRSSYGKAHGFSVRCLRDSCPQTTYSLNLNINPSGAGSVTGAGQYEAGYQVSITADASPGWEFVNWTDETSQIVSTQANFAYTMPAGDVTLTANFTAQTLNIGDFYQGGIIAYILQPGDPGYVEGEVHGLIAAPSDQGIAVEWGCYGTFIGSTSTALGTGAANTATIVAGCSEAGIAARLCNDLELNGYYDWYLPSIDELNKLYINRWAIGGFASTGYWSSSELSSYSAWGQIFAGGQNQGDKDDGSRVRAVRAY